MSLRRNVFDIEVAYNRIMVMRLLSASAWAFVFISRAGAYVTGVDAPEDSYRDGSAYTVKSLRDEHARLTADLAHAPPANQLKVLQANAAVFHTINSPVVTPLTVSATAPVASPLRTSALLPQANAPHRFSAPRVTALDDVRLDEMVISAGASWKDFLLPGAMVAGGFFGFTKGAAMIENAPLRLAAKIGSGLMVGLGSGRLAWRAIETSLERIYRRAKTLPDAMAYKTPSGEIIRVVDTFKHPDQRLSEEDLALMRHYFDVLPSNHLRHIKTVISYPYYRFDSNEGDIVRGSAHAYSGNSSGAYAFIRKFIAGAHADESYIAIDGRNHVRNVILGHEVGHHVLFNMPQDRRAEWEALHAASTNKASDFVDGYGIYGSPTPYGSKNTDEDFSTIYADWLGTGSIYGDVGLMNQALQRADQGHSLLLQKALFAAAHFTDSQKRQTAFYNFDAEDKLTRTDLTYARSANSLTLGRYTFQLRGNAIVGVSAPEIITERSEFGYSFIPALSYTFQQPIEIPAFVNRQFS